MSEVRLGDVAEVISGPAFKSADFVDSPGIKLARGDNVKEGVFYWGDKTRYWPQKEDRLEKYKLRSGDVLVGMDGSKVGKNWVEVRPDDLPCYLVQRVARIRSKGNVNQKTISFAVSSDLFRNYVESVKTGSSIPHISHRQIEDFIFPYPGEDREKFVVELISALDDKIALNRKLNQTLEGMARALFQSWFVDFDPVKAKLAAVRHGRDPECACMAALSGKLRIPPGKPKPETLDDQLPCAEELEAAIAALDTLSPAQLKSLSETAGHFPANFQESELGLIPEQWGIKALGDICFQAIGGQWGVETLEEGLTPAICLRGCDMADILVVS